MKIKLPVTWEMCGTIEVEAKDLADAIQKFNDNPDDFNLPFPHYVDDSFRLTSEDASEITEMVEQFN